MKRTLALSLVIVGCAHAVEDPLPPDVEEQPRAREPKFNEETPSDNGNRLPCDRRDKVTLVIDGKTIVMRVPALCDPMPYVEKGDPPPWNQSQSTPMSR